MAHADHEPALGGVDRRHAGTEVGAVHLAGRQHPIHPDVDHLVAEGGEQGLLGQRLQQRPGKHDLAEALAGGITPAPVEAGTAAQAPVTPAHARQRLAAGRQTTVEMLAVEPVNSGSRGSSGTPGAGGRAGQSDSGPFTQLDRSMDWGLISTIGTKVLLAGAGALLLYWTISW